jgi:hypothetical protein
LSAREAVPVCTPAAFATSFRLGRRMGDSTDRPRAEPFERNRLRPGVASSSFAP